MIPLSKILDSDDPAIYGIQTRGAAPQGEPPLEPDALREAASGDIFGWTQDAGMGWAPGELGRDEYLILTTQGGLRGADGRPLALGYHTGHWELAWLAETAAEEFRRLGTIPFAAFCTDPCDGRTQGTPGMMDSLAYRNDAATVFRRLIRSQPTRCGVLGLATCDKGLPAMMMALAAMGELPTVLVPGGVTLPPERGEDAGVVQSISVRFAQGEVDLDYARGVVCAACGSSGGGCQFLGTAATAQVVGEALGLSLPHSALSPSGQAVWLDIARRSARALARLRSEGLTTKNVVTDGAIRNAMAVHAAFGGSTNLLLHLPAIAHAAGLQRPTAEDWADVNRRVPRLVDVLPNGPVGHPTIDVYLAGGVPEVMLKLREMDLLDLQAMTITGESWGAVLDWWKASERRKRMRQSLRETQNIDPNDVIFEPKAAHDRGLSGTITIVKGNLAPQGAVIKSAAIDPTVIDSDGVYRKTGPARVFVSESAAVRAIKNGEIQPNDIMVLCCCGPMGSGMEEIYQITSSLKYLDWGKQVAVITDARFSGFSGGACIGHAGPEALAGGPIGKIVDGDVLEIVIDCERLDGNANFVGHGDRIFGADEGARKLAERAPRADLAPRPDLPDDTKIWATLQDLSGGIWGGCVYDAEAIRKALESQK